MKGLVSTIDILPQRDHTRVHPRDIANCFGILFDDRNRRMICRLCFNSSTKKHVGLFDSDKKETKYPIESPDEMLSDSLLQIAQLHETRETEPTG